MLALAQSDLACYALAHFPQFQLPPFLDLIVSKLEAVERGEITRLIISMPPRHGKSITGSTYFPAWYLGRHPEHYVIASSYGQELADDFGRRVRNTIQSPLHRAIFPGSRMADDSAAISRFNLTAGGAYFAVGRGAAITGRGAHLLLIDDPLKDSSEANSPTIRRGLQEWFAQVAFTRLQPDGAVVIFTTRWHEADLAGWLLREFADEGWESIALPAIAETNDPLGRAEGEALWPERYPIEALESIKRQLGSAAFASLYQQRPVPAEGGLIKRAWFRFYVPKDRRAELPADADVAILPDTFDESLSSWDFAVKNTSDYVAGQYWRRKGSNAYLCDRLHDRLDMPASVRALEVFSARNSEGAKLVEDKANGPAVIATLKNRVPGMIAVNPDGSKEARMLAVAPYIEAGNVWLPHPIIAPWISDLIEELVSFPNGQHDDECDALSMALHRLMHGVGRSGVFEWMRQEAERMGSGDSGGFGLPKHTEPPRISTLSPPACSTDGGELMTLTGEHLEGVTLLVDGRPVDVKETGSSRLVFVAPPHVPGAVIISVESAAGTSVSGLTYQTESRK